MSGIALRGEGPDHRTFRVKEVLENSPATEAGLAAGDVITSIDGVAASTLTLTAILEMFDKAVARQLTLQRDGRTITVTVTPRPLI
jgi:S1-C subfamily serine protease